MSPSDWVEPLFRYGPYAVLAVFALWIAPRQTKQAIDCIGKGKLGLGLASTTTIVSWAIVVTMVCTFSSNGPAPRL